MNKRILVKVGTSTLTHQSGGINLRCIERLVRVLSDIKNMGYQVLLVSSGAVGVGMERLNVRHEERSLLLKQACAAVGQVALMNIYERHFSAYNHSVAQVLLTRDVFEGRHESAKNTLDLLLENRVVPIINENDVISTDQLEFGDNDTLAAMVGVLMDVDLVVLLTDIDRLYDKDPNIFGDAQPISIVNEITPDILQGATGSSTTRGTGGMHTKILAAQMVMEAGRSLIIASGSNPKILYDIVEGKKVGTRFGDYSVE